MGHNNIIKFLNDDGARMRPFDSIEAHNEIIIRNHNSVVHPDDRVYFLGDFGDPRKFADRFLGRKVLVKGNHDDRKLSHYLGHFDDIRACVQKKGFILTHIPIHPASLGRWGINIHGHTHARRVLMHPNLSDQQTPDTRYVCVSLEQTDFFPVELTEVLKENSV